MDSLHFGLSLAIVERQNTSQSCPMGNPDVAWAYEDVEKIVGENGIFYNQQNYEFCVAQPTRRLTLDETYWN